MDVLDLRWDLGDFVATRVQDGRLVTAREETVDDEGPGGPGAADH